MAFVPSFILGLSVLQIVYTRRALLPISSDPEKSPAASSLRDGPQWLA